MNVRSALLAGALAVAALGGCADADDDATTPATTAAASLTPSCGAVPFFRSLSDDRVEARPGESVDLGIVVDRLESSAAVERLRIALASPEEAGTVASALLDGDETTPVLTAQDVQLPGAVGVAFDGRDRAGRALAPGEYRVVVAIDFAIDAGGDCPDNVLTDGPYRGWVRTSVSGELGTVVVGE